MDYKYHCTNRHTCSCDRHYSYQPLPLERIDRFNCHHYNQPQPVVPLFPPPPPPVTPIRVAQAQICYPQYVKTKNTYAQTDNISTRPQQPKLKMKKAPRLAKTYPNQVTIQPSRKPKILQPEKIVGVSIKPNPAPQKKKPVLRPQRLMVLLVKPTQKATQPKRKPSLNPQRLFSFNFKPDIKKKQPAQRMIKLYNFDLKPVAKAKKQFVRLFTTDVKPKGVQKKPNQSVKLFALSVKPSKRPAKQNKICRSHEIQIKSSKPTAKKAKQGFNLYSISVKPSARPPGQRKFVRSHELQVRPKLVPKKPKQGFNLYTINVKPSYVPTSQKRFVKTLQIEVKPAPKKPAPKKQLSFARLFYVQSKGAQKRSIQIGSSDIRFVKQTNLMQPVVKLVERTRIVSEEQAGRLQPVTDPRQLESMRVRYVIGKSVSPTRCN